MGMNNTPPIAQTKIIKPMVFVDYPNEGIAFLLNFGMAMQYPSTFQYICDESQRVFIYPKRCIAHALNNFGHKQYPSNSMDQNNLVHGVYRIPS